jgi:hypothetical protein
MKPAEKICGPCQACCIAPKIDTPELRKPSGATCVHLVERGCGIYDKRPPVCRAFLCGWRLLPELDISWRPDLSGVMLMSVYEKDVPQANRAAGPGWVFVVLDGKKALTPKLARYVADRARRNIAIYLSAVTPRTQLNEQLERPVKAGDTEGVLAILKQVHARLLPARGAKGLSLLWILYRAQVDRIRAIVEAKRR